MISVPSNSTVLALDVHKFSITAAVLEPGSDSPVLDRLGTDEESVRRLVSRLGAGRSISACYEAGPTGYELARHLEGLGVHCDVVAPSLIPKAPGDRVKTDRRDARRLAHLLRAGQLTAVNVPSPAEEAVRDLCRARTDMVIDRVRAQHRLDKFLLRHGRVYLEGSNWTARHEQWLAAQRFDEPALRATFGHYRGALSAREAELRAIEVELGDYYAREAFASGVARLSAYRGITELGALTIASEVCDWRRLPTAGAFMSFCGLVPSEHSSGQQTWRGGITHAGNWHLRTHLVESAWVYKGQPCIGVTLQRRQRGADPELIARSWRAQLHLSKKFRRLDEKKSNRKVVVTAIARELAGFCWAEMAA